MAKAKKFFCYRNLNRKGVVWSAKNTKTGLVEQRSTTFYIKNPTFKVSQAGRARVLKQKKKNVHAGVVGQLVRRSKVPDGLTWYRASYNPYTHTNFMSQYNDILETADFAILKEDGLWYSWL